MADTPTTPTPIFYEALATAAKCTPADAYEHFHTLQKPNARTHQVEAFLEEYAGGAK
jgi:hypothetical protein